MEMFKIEPHVGVGKIKLGMKMDDVYAVMGNNSAVANRRGKEIIDYYYSNCLQISYSSSLVVEYIEFSRDIEAEYSVLFKGVDVFRTPADKLIDFISRFAPYDTDNIETLIALYLWSMI